MNKIFSIAAIFFLNTLYGQHELLPGEMPAEATIPVSIILADLHVNSADIESILDNPLIEKKRKSGNMIMATGFHNGNVRHFDIHFRKQQLHGEWRTWYANEQLCESGRFKKNLPDGEWKTWYPDGQVKSVVSYSAQKYHYIKADIKRNHPKDKRYQITRYAGTNKNIRQHFQPQYPDMKKASENFSMLHKIRFNTAIEAAEYIPPFNACLHHGRYTTYFANGNVRDSGYYVNGLKHGVWKETPRPGLSSLGFYQHGEKHGQWKYYDVNGRLLYAEEYLHGRLRSSHQFKLD